MFGLRKKREERGNVLIFPHAKRLMEKGEMLADDALELLSRLEEGVTVEVKVWGVQIPLTFRIKP